MGASRWPKFLPPLTAEQARIREDFVRLWLNEIAAKRRYRFVERFNHRYPVRHAPADFRTTLEIGAGLGEHLEYERLTETQAREYVALELRESLAARIPGRFPRVQVVVGDCQSRLGFPDGYFERILAVHVLEHLPNLPAAIAEAHRLCRPRRGVFSVVIPCEGGLAYTLARRVSAQRVFQCRYGQPYRWFIAREHLNRPAEILTELAPYFAIQHRQYFPLGLPGMHWNLCIGLTLSPR